jgi:S1-C subfamily serine protease
VIRNAQELRNTIGMQRVGDQVEIGLLRDGKPLKVSALVAEHSESEAVNAVDVHRGLEGADLADAPDTGGVLVRAVQDGSPAAQAGLRAGDVIVAVGRAPVASLKAFRDVAKGANFLLLNVKRGNTVVLIPIR